MTLAKTLFSILIFTVVCITTGFAQKNKPSKYINNDSSEIFSTHASRPFKYGYAYTRKQCEEEFTDLVKAFQFKKGETVAEVGAASGWIMAAISVFTDSVTYYIEDIDSNYANQRELNAVVKHFSSLRDKPQTNSFHFVLGNFQSTNLPDKTFDKIIVNNTFHEMTKPHEMIADMKKKLAPGGMIIIGELYANEFRKVRHNGCNIPARTVKEISALFEKHGLYLVKANSPLHSVANVLYFGEDKTAHAAFMQQVESVTGFTSDLDKLQKKDLTSDSAQCAEEAMYIAGSLEEITAVFPGTEAYIESLCNQYVKEKRAASACNAMQAYTILYPQSHYAWSLWAGMLSLTKQDKEAIQVYTEAIKLFPDRPEFYEGRAYVYSENDSLNNALKDLNKAIEVSKEDADFYYTERGILYNDLDDYEKSMQDFATAIKLNPRSGEAYFERAKVNVANEYYEEAIADYTRIIELDPENKEAYFERAGARIDIGDSDGYDADMKMYKQLKKKKKK